MAESTSHKTAANALFAASQYRDAMDRYFEAIDVCPNYLDYELAVLKSNISACQIKLQEWKDAMKSATEALDGLDRLEGKGKETEVPEGKDKGKQKEGQESGDAEVEAAPKKHEEEDEEVEEEIISSGAAKAGPALPKPSEEPPSYAASEAAQKRADDVRRIRAKALMRRGRARVELGGWANLAGAGEDYALLASMDNLGAADRRAVLYQLRDLPAKTSAAKEAEMAEMWGKLKDVSSRPSCPSADGGARQREWLTLTDWRIV